MKKDKKVRKVYLIKILITDWTQEVSVLQGILPSNEDKIPIISQMKLNLQVYLKLDKD